MMMTFSLTYKDNLRPRENGVYLTKIQKQISMNNRIDDFVDNLSNEEVQQLMYKISKRVIIPQYYTKDHIKTMFDEQYGDLYKKYLRNRKIESLTENTDGVDFEKVFSDLREYFGGVPQELEETLHNLIYDFLDKEV